MEKRESIVKDLSEKLRKGDITPKEAQKELKKRGLGHKETWKDFIGYVLWGVLCFLPGFAKQTDLEILSFFAQLTPIEFPAIAIYISVALFIAMIPLAVVHYYFNSKKGGCGSEDHTVILLKSGPYGIVRHPGVLSWLIAFIAITVAISDHMPFTILSIFGNIVLIVFSYWGCLIEEKELNLKKWGDEYRQYMKEVPRWNFIKGLWNLRKRK
jgi:protein-S-isoprenylcysteine O-methyltransferase Ste14